MRTLAIAALVGALSACASKPPVIFGERMPRGCTKGNVATDERCLGWLVDRLWMVTTLRPYRDAELTAYVDSVGQRLVRAHGDRREWTFAILDSDVVNAYAGIGTHLYINRGILAVLRDEDELAAVLGHEIGHALGGHTHAALITSQTWREKRDDEIQADETGVRLLAEAGYDVNAMPRMLRALAAGELGPSDPSTDEEQSTYPSWFERIARVELAASAYAHPPRVTGGDERFQRAMANLVVGTDPRDHAMVGTTALFANIGIAVDVPEREDPDSSTDSLDFIVATPELHSVDMRLMDHNVAPLMASDQHDPDQAMHVIRGRSDSPFGRQLDLVITVKGSLPTDVMWNLVQHVRPMKREELAALRPALVNINAPRLLWAPRANLATK
ncbi:MAG TPA: M48 family metalloprotease [Kofleriaceae bacterium]